jgi:hypothetical protein
LANALKFLKLMNFQLSTDQITFLSDVPSNLEVDMTSGWRYHYFNAFSPSEIHLYLRLIEDNKIFLIIPLFGTSKLLSKPILHMSHPFLINKESNPLLISGFILEQWKSSGFYMGPETDFTFSFKFKRVSLDYK